MVHHHLPCAAADCRITQFRHRLCYKKLTLSSSNRQTITCQFCYPSTPYSATINSSFSKIAVPDSAYPNYSSLIFQKSNRLFLIIKSCSTILCCFPVCQSHLDWIHIMSMRNINGAFQLFIYLWFQLSYFIYINNIRFSFIPNAF